MRQSTKLSPAYPGGAAVPHTPGATGVRQKPWTPRVRALVRGPGIGKPAVRTANLVASWT